MHDCEIAVLHEMDVQLDAVAVVKCVAEGGQAVFRQAFPVQAAVRVAELLQI